MPCKDIASKKALGCQEDHFFWASSMKPQCVNMEAGTKGDLLLFCPPLGATPWIHARFTPKWADRAPLPACYDHRVLLVRLVQTTISRKGE